MKNYHVHYHRPLSRIADASCPHAVPLGTMCVLSQLGPSILDNGRFRLHVDRTDLNRPLLFQLRRNSSCLYSTIHCYSAKMQYGPSMLDCPFLKEGHASWIPLSRPSSLYLTTTYKSSPSPPPPPTTISTISALEHDMQSPPPLYYPR